VLGICSLAAISLPAITLAAPAPVSDDVAVKLEPIVDGIPKIEPGEKGKASFLFTNMATRELKLTWKTQIYLPGNKPGNQKIAGKPDLAQTEMLQLAAGGTKRVVMPEIVAARRGVVTFDWQMTNQDRTI